MAISLLALVLSACDDRAADGSGAGGLQRLTIESASGGHVFKIEVAVTPEQQAQGLMFRRHLDADAGMLFVHEREDVVTMWMKNTFIPLDMIFIARNGRVARIAERTVPHSEAVVSSGEAVVAVLEVNGGTAAHLGIKEGDRVTSPALSGYIAAR
jgi:uncharacterized membrane protein (UPF0127 family)